MSVPAPAYADTTLGADPCHRLLTSFAGVPVSQFWADFYLWELILNDRPELEGIVEIGTWRGGFSRYLASQAYWRGMEFRTFDVLEPEPETPGFECVDVFAQAEQIGAILARGRPIALLCDGGNKPREMKTFTPYLCDGSVLVVHDWLTEVQPEDVPRGLTPVYEVACETLGSMSRAFEVEA